MAAPPVADVVVVPQCRPLEPRLERERGEPECVCFWPERDVVVRPSNWSALPSAAARADCIGIPERSEAIREAVTSAAAVRPGRRSTCIDEAMGPEAEHGVHLSRVEPFAYWYMMGF